MFLFKVVFPLAISVHASITGPVCRQLHIQAPRVGQRCITDTQIYTNKTGVRDQHHCTWLCMLDPNCRVINYNSIGAYCLLGQGPCVSLENEADFVTTAMQSKKPCFKWVTDYENDIYKPITFPMITDPSDSLIILRGREDNNVLPGKGALQTGYMYYSWEGNEVYSLFTDGQPEFLTLSPECTISWVHHDFTTGQPLPAGAVIGGHLNDVPLYVSRKFTVYRSGDLAMYSSGYYNDIEGQAHMPYGALDRVYTETEILVVQDWKSGPQYGRKTVRKINGGRGYFE